MRIDIKPALFNWVDAWEADGVMVLREVNKLSQGTGTLPFWIFPVYMEFSYTTRGVLWAKCEPETAQEFVEWFVHTYGPKENGT